MSLQLEEILSYYLFYCQRCEKQNTHTVVRNFDYPMKVSRPLGYIEGIGTHILTNAMIQCEDCGWISFLQCGTNPTTVLPIEGVEGFSPSFIQYPDQFKKIDKRFEYDRSYFEHIPFSIIEAWEEVLRSYEIHHRYITSIGIRAILEALCNEVLSLYSKNEWLEELGSLKEMNIEKKIDALFSLGFISMEEAKSLHVPRKYGNRSAHSLQPYPPNTLRKNIQLIDQLMVKVNLFIQKKLSDDLGK